MNFGQNRNTFLLSFSLSCTNNYKGIQLTVMSEFSQEYVVQANIIEESWAHFRISNCSKSHWSLCIIVIIVVVMSSSSSLPHHHHHNRIRTKSGTKVPTLSPSWIMSMTLFLWRSLIGHTMQQMAKWIVHKKQQQTQLPKPLTIVLKIET